MTTVTVFSCSGWQDIQRLAARRMPVKVRKMQIPADVHSGATDYTHARHADFDALCENVCEDAGVRREDVTFEVVEVED